MNTIEYLKSVNKFTFPCVIKMNFKHGRFITVFMEWLI
jgi:hypothetical protein